ncbi:MAG TPA: DNA mismatch repair protein MutS [Desulfobacteraceae bacterium]|nr:DNA mismatch repair protein MutS [Desulfobacteraceae bacterium]HPQ29714.1 DNA mismatch repair protein MutS [Desulfobacteraceae bacterium]
MTLLTPMLKQYLSIKNQYPDSILFFRMGDFYEMFFEDARVGSRILGITLTSRGTYQGKKIPMCGIPHHASKSYIGKLVNSGKKVAICEQTEDPKSSKGIVKREVMRVVTPGSIIDEGDVDDRSNLYVAAVFGRSGDNVSQNEPDGGDKFGIAHADLSTGEFRLTEVASWNELLDELGRINPAELLIPEGSHLSGRDDLSRYNPEFITKVSFDPSCAEVILKSQFGVKSLAGFGCQDMQQGIVAAAAVVQYLQDTQKGFPAHIKEVLSYHTGDYMFLDESTCSHLELLKTMRRQSIQGSLLQIIDRTVTPMGGRLMKKRISYPLINLDIIKKRLAAVACLKDGIIIREKIRGSLKEIYDLERLNGRIALNRANARDLLALKYSILKLPSIKDCLDGLPSMLLSEIGASLDTLTDIADLINNAIHEEPPVSVREGGIIKQGYNDDLDRLVSLSRDGKSWITKFAASEQQRTGISSLKVGFNRVFGYYIEISKANLHLTPSDYIRKQTMVNAERFITESLKDMEEQILSAEERRIELEFKIFDEIRSEIALKNQRIKATAELIAEIDLLSGLAETAEINNYVCPEVNDGTNIDIIDGRHPVIEQTVKEEEFVPNDIHLDSTDQQVLIITGPNMAGKSTILRQCALTILMAQMGSFVPASKAVIGIVDRIFTRVGASDDLGKGHSTFMVEMNETANILRYATPRSLVILDEIGRGTSTYDGLSIAWAVAEALHDRDNLGVRTLFATHYHELTELVTTKQRVKNFNIAVREWNDSIIFLRNLIPGGTSRSYGIQVARIAGLPENVLKRADEILNNLQGSELDNGGIPRLAHSCETENESDILQLNLFGSHDHELRERILGLNIAEMTPLEALIEIDKLKEYVSNKK